MSILLLSMVALLCLFCWVIAETENSLQLVRVGLGCLTMAAVAALAFGFARFTPGLESGSVRESLRLAEQLMAAGNNQRVQQALHAYNKEVASASTYKASFELWKVLNHGPQPAVSAKRDQVPPDATGARPLR